MEAPRARSVAVFASGGGSNLTALMDYMAAAPTAAARVALVVSNRPDAGALARAAAAGIPTTTLRDPGDGPAIEALLDRHEIDLVVLAGYLRLIPESVVRSRPGAIVNVHPALLPHHGGAGMHGRRVHEAVLRAGDARSGATVHFVDAAYDRGAPIAWAEVAVEPDDTPDTLAARVLAAEHFLLPRVVDAIARDMIRLRDGRTRVTADCQTAFSSPPAGVAVRLAADSPESAKDSARSTPPSTAT